MVQTNNETVNPQIIKSRSRESDVYIQKMLEEMLDQTENQELHGIQPHKSLNSLSLNETLVVLNHLKLVYEKD
jgi:hypothetical protein